jgi:pimeloyl-ACP methyl ester carboxylesterase
MLGRVTAKLHHDFVTAPGAEPARWLLLTHGMFGTGGNWRSIARRVLERRPEWGAVLVDLRGHGRSDSGPPPHTVAACASDLAALIEELATAGRRVEAASGHSFGGKVVLALRAVRAPLLQTWVLDSTPSPRPGLWDRAANDVRAVWESLGVLPARFAKRDDFVAALLARGHSPALSGWLALSLRPEPGGGVRLGLDRDVIRLLAEDYYRVDLWPAVEDASLPGETRFMVADLSDTVSPADRARLAAEPLERRVHTHLVLGADHWLHVDAPAQVIDLLASALPVAIT